MLTVYRNMFRIRDLRNKIFFTLFIFLIYRLGTAIPVPGVDLDAVEEFAALGEQAGIMGLLNLFSGGALEAYKLRSVETGKLQRYTLALDIYIYIYICIEREREMHTSLSLSLSLYLSIYIYFFIQTQDSSNDKLY